MVYQLLEEMLDDGSPLTTEPNALKAMIRPPSVIGCLQAVATGKSNASRWDHAAYLDIIEEFLSGTDRLFPLRLLAQ